MLWMLVIISAVLVVGIIIINSLGKQTRSQFLKDLETFLDGKLEPMDDKSNGYKITFSIEGMNMVFEDVPEVGFESEAFRGILRAPLGFKYALNFTEKEKRKTMGSSMVTISDKPTDAVQDRISIKLPEPLNMFNVFTDDSWLTNKIILDKQCLELFVKYKNTDVTGYPIMPLRIINGEVLLDFHSSGSLKPSMDEIRADKAKMDNYVDEISRFVQRIRGMK